MKKKKKPIGHTTRLKFSETISMSAVKPILSIFFFGKVKKNGKWEPLVLGRHKNGKRFSKLNPYNRISPIPFFFLPILPRNSLSSLPISLFCCFRCLYLLPSLLPLIFPSQFHISSPLAIAELQFSYPSTMDAANPSMHPLGILPDDRCASALLRPMARRLQFPLIVITLPG